MDDLALEEVRHRSEPDVRMGRHVQSLTGHARPTVHLVEEREWTHHASCRGGQDATDADAAEITGATIDDVGNRGDRCRVRTLGLDDGSDTHGTTPRP